MYKLKKNEDGDFDLLFKRKGEPDWVKVDTIKHVTMKQNKMDKKGTSFWISEKEDETPCISKERAYDIGCWFHIQSLVK